MRPYFISLFLFYFCLNCQGQKIENGYSVIIEVYTGNLPGAGTDRTVDMQFSIGGSFVKIDDLSKQIKGNALERSGVDIFTYQVPNLGEITDLKVSVNRNNKINDVWLLSRIDIQKPNNIKARFAYNGWLGNEHTKATLTALEGADPKMEALGHPSSIEVVTSNASGAGTNANVYLTIQTEHGYGSPIKLNSKIHGDAFEKGKTDLIYIELPYFEVIKSINIRHDNKGMGAGWYLDEIRIKNKAKKEFTFQCYCLMEGDQNQRTLFPIGQKDAQAIFFQSAIDGKFLDVQWGNSDNQTPLHLWTGNKGNAQKFYLEKSGPNYYKIKSALGLDKYVTIRSKEAQSLIVISDRQIQDYHKWYFEKLPNSDYYTIQSKTGLYLDVQWAANKDGTPIWLWERNADIAQQWRILKMSKGKLVPISLEDL